MFLSVFNGENTGSYSFITFVSVSLPLSPLIQKINVFREKEKKNSILNTSCVNFFFIKKCRHHLAHAFQYNRLTGGNAKEYFK